MRSLKLSDDIYGELLPFIQNENITDINWNGRELWIDDITKGRYVSHTKLDQEFISVFSTRIANLVNANFNKFYPVLEGETDELRLSIVHEDVTNTGRTISIRKTPPERRLERKEMIQTGYCDTKLDDFMKACITAENSIIVVGTPGTGKTEYVKYLTQFIPENERVITIEDSLELRYSMINPKSDSVEFKVDNDFTYQDAIKTSLRQLPKWILLSEARSIEVLSLLESASAGTGCITTLHTNDVRNIPDRISNMIGELGKDKINDIYSFFKIGVLITKDIHEGKITRRIEQVAIFDRENGVNKIIMVYDHGEYTGSTLPFNLLNTFKRKNIKNPLEMGIKKNV